MTLVKVTALWENYTICDHAIVKKHEIAKTVAVVVFVCVR